MRSLGFRSIIAAASAAALAVGTPVCANARSHHAQQGHASGKLDEKIRAKAPPNFDAIMSLMDKLFPAQADPEPARLALARTSVEAMWPDGAYAKMMTGFIGDMVTGVMQLKNSDLASLANKPTKARASTESDNQTIHDRVAAKDPYFDQRLAAMRAVIDDELGKISAVIDPRMREGLARSLARRLDARQLADVNAFFATPSGHALASQYMQLWFEPDTLRSIMSTVPEMMKLMPEAMQKFKAANDKFPSPHPERQEAPKH